MYFFGPRFLIYKCNASIFDASYDFKIIELTVLSGLIKIQREILEKKFFRRDDDDLVLYFIQKGIISVPHYNTCPRCGKENVFYSDDRLYFKSKRRPGQGQKNENDDSNMIIVPV